MLPTKTLDDGLAVLLRDPQAAASDRWQIEVPAKPETGGAGLGGGGTGSVSSRIEKPYFTRVRKVS